MNRPNDAVAAFETADVARILVGGAAFSVFRLTAVVIAGLLGTVLLARALGPHAWGVYSAGWSAVLLAAAVLVNGVRDRLVAGVGVVSIWSVAVLASGAMFVVAILVVAGVVVLGDVASIPHADVFLTVLAVWAICYPLRLPAMVMSVRSVAPIRVMVLESLDAVVAPVAALAGLVFFGDDLRAMSAGVVIAALIGVLLAAIWGRPVQRGGSFGQSVRTWIDARHLTLFQLVAAGRELAVPALVLAGGGAAAAGAYGIALPLGAMVSLGLAAAAQPAYGAIAAMGINDPRVPRLTNIAASLLGSLCAVLVPLVWLLTPLAVEVVYGDQWTYATTTITIVVVTFALNASLVPWVNVLMLDTQCNRRLLEAQAGATLLVVVAAASTGVIGGVEWVAATFLLAQMGFGCVIAATIRRRSHEFRIFDQAWYVAAAAAGVFVVELLDGVTASAGMLVSVAILVVAPTRRRMTAAWRRVISALR